MILNPLTAFSGPREEAQKAINRTHEYAKQTAVSLVQRDIDSLILDISKNEIFKNKSTLDVIESFRTLEKNIIKQIDKANSVKKIDTDSLGEIIKSYRTLVRDRFRQSFEAQQMVYDREQAVRSFELIFNRFNNICKMGRSENGLTKTLPILPRIPDAQYSFNFGVGYGSDVGSGARSVPGNVGGVNVASSSLTVDAKSEDREKGAQVLYGTTGLAWSLASSGASGAGVAMAAAAAPYLLGASLAAAVVLYAISAHEQMMLEKEIVQAKVDLMLKSADDKDIAKYYKQYCSEIGNRFSRVQKKLKLFSYSEKTRLSLEDEVRNSRSLRAQLKKESLEIQESRNLVQLIQLNRSGLCISILESQESSPCLKNGNILKSKYSRAQYDPDSLEDNSKLERALNDLKSFSEKYPQDLLVDLHSDEILDYLINYWNEVSAGLDSLNLNAVDSLMSTLAQRVQLFIVEVQKAKNSKWAQEERFLENERKFENEFISFRKEYFQILNKSILVIFGKEDVFQARKSFVDFQKRYDVFSSKVYLNKNVQSLGVSVKSLGNFYAKL